MVEIDLETAWQTYKEKSIAGWARIKKAESLLKEAAGIPVNGKLSLWLLGSEMCVEAIAERAQGYQDRLNADRDWALAVTAVHGDIRVEWSDAAGYFKCRLSTGEFFE